MIQKNILGLLLVLVIGIFIGSIIPNIYHIEHEMSIDEMRTNFISLKEDIQENMRYNEQYKCCLEKPCTYCIEKTPEHGEEAECSCLEDVVNGVHPCGECIGEILEGHGNKFLSKYFARAIAEKTGHIDAIKQIIYEKYGTPLEEQV